MRLLRGTLFLIAFLPVVATGVAQQPSGKPVLSAQPTPKQPAPGPPAIKGMPVTPDYVIGASDVLQVSVWTDRPEPDMSVNGIPVRPDGKISLPLIQDVQAAGLTAMHLGDDITARLKKYVADPTVNVAVLQVNSKQVFLIGEIARIGALQITPGMTVLQAIASAGGLTPYANKKRIYILRGEQGKQQKIPFDYNKALKKDDMQGVSLVAGDTIVVP